MAKLEVNRRELRTIVEALQRAAGWSDLGDNGAYYGKNWSAKEKAYLERCRELERWFTRLLGQM